jgi:ElaB/YqjD/DUF883 family membrane-anchored ribosome-binding protein
MHMFETLTPPKDKLMSDLRQVICDAEELLSVTADQAGDGVTALRERIQERLQVVQAELAGLPAAAYTRVKAASEATDAYVHRNPWASIGVGTAVGMILGLVIARRP